MPETYVPPSREVAEREAEQLRPVRKLKVFSATVDEVGEEFGPGIAAYILTLKRWACVWGFRLAMLTRHPRHLQRRLCRPRVLVNRLPRKLHLDHRCV